MTRIDMDTLAQLGGVKSDKPKDKKISLPNKSPFQEMRSEAFEKVENISVSLLTSFPSQPFQPLCEDRLNDLCESIKRNGIFEPIKVRPFENGYQIISGHNRTQAAKIIGIENVPCIVKELSDDQAKIELIETNLLQRSEFLPSEKALAYRMRADILGATSCRTTQQISDEVTESKRQIQRYIRLSHLCPTLLEHVDNGKLTMVVGVELSFLKQGEQEVVYDFFFGSNRNIDFATAKHIKVLSQKEEITWSILQKHFADKDIQPIKSVTIKYSIIKKIIPNNLSKPELEKIIVKLLTEHFKKEGA